MSKLTLEEASKKSGGEIVQASSFAPEVEAEGSQEDSIEAISDVLTTLPQDMLLEHADEALAQVSPELAQEYREAVKVARERSPWATTVSSLFTPDVLTLLGPMGLAGKMKKIGQVLSKVGKGKGIVGSAAQDIATSIAMQHGIDGEVDPLETGMSAVAGQAMRSIPRALGGDFKDIRASYTGLKKQPELIKSKMGGDTSAKEVLDSMMESMDLEHGLFTGGKAAFNPKSLKFETSKIGGIKGKIIPPSDRELLSRANKAKKAIWEEIEKHESGLKAVFNKEDLTKHGFQEIAGEVATTSEAEEKAVQRLLKGIEEDLFPSGFDRVGSEKILKAKRKLYERIDYLKEGTNSYLIPARKKMTRVLNNMIEEVSDSEQYTRLNKKYGEFADMQTALKSRDLLQNVSTEKVLNPSIYGTGMKYGALSFLKDKMTDVQKPFSQMGAAMEQVPFLQEAIQTPVRKGAAGLMLDREGREPQGEFNPMPAQERMDMNLPRKLVEARLPRTTEGLAKNAQIFKMKIAQNSSNLVKDKYASQGMDPESIDPEQIQGEAMDMYEDVDDILTNRPDEIGAILPNWITLFPDMFEKDRYGRIDGVVPATRQPEVREEIRKNPKISNKQRIKQLDLLNRSGEYSDEAEE